MELSLLHYSRLDIGVEILGVLILLASYFFFKRHYRLVWLAVFLALAAYYTYVSYVPFRAILMAVFALYQGIRLGRSEKIRRRGAR
jgi:hypothetical protein